MDVQKSLAKALSARARAGIPVFWGSDPGDAKVAKRRAKNKRAKASRKLNRKH